MIIRDFTGGGKTILVVAPHADDEALGAGGLLGLASGMGARIHVQYVTVSGFAPQRGGSGVGTSQRMAEVGAVAARLNLASYDVLFEGEQHHLRLDACPVHDLLSWMESGSACSLTAVDPDVVLIPSGKHNHQDHRAVHQACMGLARARVGGKPRLFIEYEIPTSCCPGTPAFDPRVYVRLDEDLMRFKKDVFSLYASQVCEPPGLRSLYAVETLARLRGLECGAEFAEAFELALVTI